MPIDSEKFNKSIKRPDRNRTADSDIKQDNAADTASAEPVQPKAGRPKTKKEAEKIINISVPLSTYKKMNLAKLNYNNNLTLYINSLIEHDLAENLDKYKEKLLDI